ncbi:hypothetical protein F4775DRAFT_561612 [Biscogniauxia sp. FL1348]|nr:hypothetical protein F4775DRAFT_561612 [Biscogniauxia sp. FL1348]
MSIPLYLCTLPIISLFQLGDLEMNPTRPDLFNYLFVPLYCFSFSSFLLLVIFFLSFQQSNI